MKPNDIIQLVLFFGLIIGLAPVLGRFMARVFSGQRTFLHPVLQPVENAIYKVSGINSAEEMTWLRYFWAVLIFNVVGLLSLMAIHTPLWRLIVAMIILGLGLGMVMQVLVLAAQNAVDYKLLGVATSGSTLFRQVGGSIGVSAFGAIFTNRLATELKSKLPPGTVLPKSANPEVVKHLPAAVHAPYVQAFVDALQPVFVTATGISAVAFLLTWLLREVPLRTTSRRKPAAAP